MDGWVTDGWWVEELKDGWTERQWSKRSEKASGREPDCVVMCGDTGKGVLSVGTLWSGTTQCPGPREEARLAGSWEMVGKEP